MPKALPLVITYCCYLSIKRKVTRIMLVVRSDAENPGPRFEIELEFLGLSFQDPKLLFKKSYY